MRQLAQKFCEGIQTHQFWLIAAQFAMAAVTVWMAYETRRMANETQKSVALLGIQLREERPLLKGEVVPNFSNLCGTKVIVRNIGGRVARQVKWRLFANLINIARREPERRELTNGVIPELRAFVDPEDAASLTDFDLSRLKDWRLTHRLYSLEFSAEHMAESLIVADASLLSVTLDAPCQGRAGGGDR